MKIMITGSNGQLGNEMQVLAKNSCHTFVYTDIKELDITDKEAVEKFIEKEKPDFLVNCAAYTDVNKAESDLELANKINAIAPLNLALGCKKNNCKLIHVSTDYVFDGNNYLPYKETDATNPQSAYGRTKLLGEQNIQNTLEDYIIIRTAWLYSSFGKNFVKTMVNLGKSREEISVVFDQIGSPTYANDLAKVIMQIINLTSENKDNFKAGIYHFSNQGVCSWYDFTVEIFKIFDINCKVKAIETYEYPTPATRPHYSVLNKKKIEKTFDFKVPFWRDSLLECAKLIKESDKLA